MKDKDGNDVVFVINNEEGEYLQHLKKYALCDNYPKPNRNDFKIKSNIGRFVKVENLNKPEPEENPNLTPEQRKKNIHEGHRKRLREMFNNVPPTSLPEHQVLELMLSYVQPQKDVNPLAHTLLNEFGNLANVLDADIEDLKRVNGIGEVLASFIHFCSKIPAIYNNSKVCYHTKLANPSQIVDFLRSKVTFNNKEEFYYLCLDSGSNVLCFKCLGTGTTSKLYVDNRLLIQDILKYPTGSVVICHTHPHGRANPSYEDKNVTFTLSSLLEKLNIRLLDHVIISPNGYFSFFETGTEGFGKDTNIRNSAIFSFPPNLMKDEND